MAEEQTNLSFLPVTSGLDFTDDILALLEVVGKLVGGEEGGVAGQLLGLGFCGEVEVGAVAGSGGVGTHLIIISNYGR